MRVAGASAEPLIANRINGKIIGKTSSARCRSVRTTARRATASVCSPRLVPCEDRPAPGERPMLSSTATPPSPAAAARADRLCDESTFARPFELAARLGEEHVVERWLMELERLHAKVGLVEDPDDLGQLGLSPRQLDRHGP